LAIIDGAADAAIEARRSRRWLDLYGKAEIDAVRLSQMPLECLDAAPDIDDLRMVRGEQPIDDPEALDARIRLAGVTILE